MPNVSVTLPETQQSVSRPIIYSIISDLEDITKISKDVRIIYPGDSGRIAQPSSTIDDTNDRSALLGSHRYVFIEVDEDYDKDIVGATAVAQLEYIPVFIDDALGVFIAPIYASSNVTINFKYRTNSKTEAERWRDDMRIKISQLRDINIHSVVYHYLVPKPFIELLETIYEYRERIAGYGNTIAEYIVEKSTDRLTLVGSVDGNHRELAISETQTRIIGRFDWDTLPDKPEKDTENGAWTIGFSYKFSYDKPVACNMRYPIIVHNRLLPAQYTVIDHQENNSDYNNMAYSVSLSALSYFEQQRQVSQYLNTDSLIKLPAHDDYIAKHRPPGTGDVFYALCEVDEVDRIALMNLNELGGLVINRDILDFIIQSEYPYLTKLYNSIIYVSLYRGEYPASDGTISCSNTLDISATNPLNLRLQHRVRFSLVTDLTKLTIDAINRLLKYPKAFVAIINAINEILRDNPGVASLGDKRYITQSDFSDIYRILTGVNFYQSRNMKVYPRGREYYFLDPFRNLTAAELEFLRRNSIQRNRLELSYIISDRMSRYVDNRSVVVSSYTHPNI